MTALYAAVLANWPAVLLAYLVVGMVRMAFTATRAALASGKGRY